MQIEATQWSRICVAVLMLTIAAGCTSQMVTVMRKPPVNAQKLGRVEGTAIGSLFGIIPVMENSRTSRAYNRALAKAPGATALMDITLQEDWYWFYLGTLRSVTISGEAVK